MARRRSGVALAAAGTVPALLVVFELLIGHTRAGTSGPVGAVLLLGALSGTRR